MTRVLVLVAFTLFTASSRKPQPPFRFFERRIEKAASCAVTGVPSENFAFRSLNVYVLPRFVIFHDVARSGSSAVPVAFGCTSRLYRFWVSQMLSLTEFCAGSSVSILTAFASTKVSLAEADPRVSPRSAAAAATPTTTSAVIAAITTAFAARRLRAPLGGRSSHIVIGLLWNIATPQIYVTS